MNTIDVLRVEKKYQLTGIEAALLERKLEQILPRDSYGGDMGYRVRSLYFDTMDDGDFFEKEDGYEYRKKIRLRVYSPEDQTAKLEMKEKQGEFQRKRSLVLEREDAMALIRGDYGSLLKYENGLAMEMYCMMQERMYRPKCVVEYNRNAFSIPENSTRITLDSRIMASEACFDIFHPELQLYPVDDYDHVTLEVKYNRFLFSYIKDVVSSCDKMQLSYSKYCMARRIFKGLI